MSCQCQCNAGNEPGIYAIIDEIVEKYKGQAGSLIPVLHQTQQALGYLPENVQAYIAEKLGIPLSEV